MIVWDAPAYDGGNSITNYEVFMDDGSGGDFSSLGLTATLTWTSTGLSSGLLYKFKVAAFN